MRAILSGVAAEQNQLRVKGVVNVRSQIKQTDAAPPHADGRAKIVAVRDDKSDGYSPGQSELKQATAENGHEFAERYEQHMTGLVDRQQDVVHERRADFPVAVIIRKKTKAPEGQQHEHDTTCVERYLIKLVERFQQGAGIARTRGTFFRCSGQLRLKRQLGLFPFEKINTADRAGCAGWKRLRRFMSALGTLRIEVLHQLRVISCLHYNCIVHWG